MRAPPSPTARPYSQQMRVRFATERWPELPSVTVGDAVGAGEVVSVPSGLSGRVSAIGPSTKSSVGPDELRAFVEIVVQAAPETARDVGIGLFTAWLYDRLRTRGEGRHELSIDGTVVDPDDVVEVERMVRNKLYPPRDQ